MAQSIECVNVNTIATEPTNHLYDDDDDETQSTGFEPIENFELDCESKDDQSNVIFEPSCEGADEDEEPDDVMKDAESHVCEIRAVNEITVEMIRDEQLADGSMSSILKSKEEGEDRPTYESISDRSTAEKSYWRLWDVLAVKDGILVKRWEAADGRVIRWLTVLPKGLRRRVLDELHASPVSGHLGRNKTLPKVQERFFWVGMTADVRSYLKQCTPCARRKAPPKKSRAPLQQLPVGAPLERIAVDILGPLTETADGNVYVLVIGDYWTKWMECYPIPNQQAETVASKIVDEFVCRFGVPTELHSDQGRNFESQVFKEMCKLLNISKTRTTPYNPKSDGLIERYNRTIVNAVALMIQPHQHQTDWDKYLPYVGLAYRSSVQATTGETPNMMMIGREITLPIDLAFGGVPDEKEMTTDYAEELRERIRGIHERARYALKVNMRRQKRNHDLLAKEPKFKEGQFVWLHNRSRRPGLSRKLALPWEGPYQIVTRLSDVHCRIQQSQRSKCKIVHVDRLKRYEGPELKPWLYKPSSDSLALQEEPVATQRENKDTVEEVPETTKKKDQDSTEEEPKTSKHRDQSAAVETVEVENPHEEPQNEELPFSQYKTGHRRNPERIRNKPARYR